MSKKTRDIPEIAQKQRHLSLLEKVRENKTLSKAELRELKKLEHRSVSPMQVED